MGICLFVDWSRNVPATCECISGTDLLDNFTCCHTEIEVADPTFHLTQSQYTDTGPTSPSTDPITPAAWQGSHRSANFEVTGMTRPQKNPVASGDLNQGTAALKADTLTTRPTRRWMGITIVVGKGPSSIQHFAHQNNTGLKWHCWESKLIYGNLGYWRKQSLQSTTTRLAMFLCSNTTI